MQAAHMISTNNKKSGKTTAESIYLKVFTLETNESQTENV
jgi:hypothetical protein